MAERGNGQETGRRPTVTGTAEALEGIGQVGLAGEAIRTLLGTAHGTASRQSGAGILPQEATGWTRL